jgi:hypothetical protein
MKTINKQKKKDQKKRVKYCMMFLLKLLLDDLHIKSESEQILVQIILLVKPTKTESLWCLMQTVLEEMLRRIKDIMVPI